MLHSRCGQIALLLAAAAMILCGRSLGHGRPAAQRTSTMGNEDLMFHLLSPTVLSFAAPLFRMRGLIFSNARQVVGGSVACTSTALSGIALASRLLSIPKAFKMALRAKSQAETKTSLGFKLGKSLRFLSPFHYHEAHPSPTVAAALGAYASPAIAGVLVLTRVLGALFEAGALDALGAKDRVMRGLVKGGPQNVLGMAAIAEQETLRNGFMTDTATGASMTRDMSTAGTILTVVAGAMLAHIPFIRSVLLSIALGKSTVGAAAQ